MITPWIDDHVSALRRVTIHTLRSRLVWLVEMMRGRVVVLVLQARGIDAGTRCRRRRVVTTGAQRITRRPDLQRMRIVAITAAQALLIHLRLQERTVLVHLPVDLAIVEVEMGVQQRRQMRVEQRLAVFVVTPDHGAA